MTAGRWHWYRFLSPTSPNQAPAGARPIDRNHNGGSQDFICCGITSNLANRQNSVLLDPTEMVEGSIPVRSRIKYDKVFTLEKSLIVKSVGRVSTQKAAKVKQGLISLLG